MIIKNKTEKIEFERSEDKNTLTLFLKMNK